MTLLLKSNAARVVNVASTIHLLAEFQLGDFNLKHTWSALRAYGLSKLLEVRRVARRGARACLPGGALPTRSAPTPTLALPAFFRLCSRANVPSG